MRGVAAGAGVSLGLVQHHFATKAGLTKAVDDYVVDLLVGSFYSCVIILVWRVLRGRRLARADSANAPAQQREPAEA